MSYIRTDECKRKSSESQSGEKSYNWKGDLYEYWHEKARELFGKPFCED